MNDQEIIDWMVIHTKNERIRELVRKNPAYVEELRDFVTEHFLPGSVKPRVQHQKRCPSCRNRQK